MNFMDRQEVSDTEIKADIMSRLFRKHCWAQNIRYLTPSLTGSFDGLVIGSANQVYDKNYRKAPLLSLN